MKFSVFPEESRKIIVANFSHDSEHGRLRDFIQSKTKPGWDVNKLAIRPLTNKAIERYRKMGFYS